MKRFILTASVAALALSIPAIAKPGGGHGGEHAAKAQHGGGGHAKAQRDGGGSARVAQRGGSDRRGGQAMRASKQQQVRIADAHRPSHVRRADVRERARADRPAKLAQRDRRDDRARMRNVDRERGHQTAVRNANRDSDRLFDQRVAQRGRDIVRLRDSRDSRWIDRDFAGRGLMDGCPPGLAMKNNGCLPPGQAKKLVGSRLPAAYRNSMLPDRLRDYYRDSDDYYYRYGDGYLYRVNRQDNLVSALLPMFGSALGLGTPFPSAYSSYAVPPYYQSFYPSSGDSYYRYANGNVYGIDPRTGLIEDVVPLMAGGYGVGQLLPAGYSAYNVPYQYRDYYPDSSDGYYRYAPGAIYQVDPRTNLVTSVASLLSPTGFAVGQPLPMGYSAYNVPYQYRSQYYDTPDAMYRYNNGYIYQVDPTTQLISAVIRAIV